MHHRRRERHDVLSRAREAILKRCVQRPEHERELQRVAGAQDAAKGRGTVGEEVRVGRKATGRVGLREPNARDPEATISQERPAKRAIVMRQLVFLPRRSVDLENCAMASGGAGNPCAASSATTSGIGSASLGVGSSIRFHSSRFVPMTSGTRAPRPSMNASRGCVGTVRASMTGKNPKATNPHRSTGVRGP